MRACSVICLCVCVSVRVLVTLVIPSKAVDEPIEMPFATQTRVGPRNHVPHMGATKQIRLNNPCSAAMGEIANI